MIIYGVKYACATCIRGHRASSCQHSDRPLFEIRKKGRPPTQCSKCRDRRKNGGQHSRCVCDSPVPLPSSPSSPSPSKRAIRYRVNPLLNPCQCASGGPCACAPPRKASTRSRSSSQSRSVSSTSPSTPVYSSANVSSITPSLSTSPQINNNNSTHPPPPLYNSPPNLDHSSKTPSPNSLTSTTTNIPDAAFDPEAFLESLLAIPMRTSPTSSIPASAPTSTPASFVNPSVPLVPEETQQFVNGLLSGSTVKHPVSGNLVRLVSADNNSPPHQTKLQHHSFADSSSPSATASLASSSSAPNWPWGISAIQKPDPLHFDALEHPLSSSSSSSTTTLSKTGDQMMQNQSASFPVSRSASDTANWFLDDPIMDPTQDLDILLPPQMMPEALFKHKGCGCMCGSDCACSQAAAQKSAHRKCHHHVNAANNTNTDGNLDRLHHQQQQNDHKHHHTLHADTEPSQSSASSSISSTPSFSAAPPDLNYMLDVNNNFIFGSSKQSPEYDPNNNANNNSTNNVVPVHIKAEPQTSAIWTSSSSDEIRNTQKSTSSPLSSSSSSLWVLQSSL